MTKYQQIVEYIEKCIKNEIFPKGSAIPSEQELGAMFQCSRMTVRRALDELAAEGVVYKTKGRGTFVSNIAFDRLYSLKGFSQIMREQGIDYSSEVLIFEILNSSKDVAQHLKILQETEVYCLKRVRKAMGKAISIECVYLPVQEFPGLMDYDFAQCSLYETLANVYGVKIERAVQSISTEDIEGEEAKILFGKKKGVALKSVSVGYGKNFKPVEYENALYNGYKYTIDVVIKGEN